ncbi:MAG: hypothetical protein J1E95_02315 [Muribaculaceae bacterium]|nr:hypothetical protein [Muribaculaceae bacterium]
MKKLSKYCILCTLFLGSFFFCACEKSNKDLLNDYQNVSKEIVSAINNGNLEEAKKLSEKGEKIDKELGERDLSDSEKEEKNEIEAEMISALSEMSPF